MSNLETCYLLKRIVDLCVYLLEEYNLGDHWMLNGLVVLAVINNKGRYRVVVENL